jgi:NTF2-like N-terminal transpeptidase domain
LGIRCWIKEQVRKDRVFLKLNKFLLAVLCLLGFLLTGCTANDNLLPADVLQRYLEAVRDSRYSQAYDYLTADSKLKITAGDFSDRQNRAKLDAGISEIKIVQVNREASIVGNRASVTYQLEVTLQNGQKLPLYEAAVLLKQESGWRIIWPPQ